MLFLVSFVSADIANISYNNMVLYDEFDEMHVSY
jgi:hypothetical protein